MKIHQKAWLYETLISDIEKFKNSLKEHHQKIEHTKDREDLKQYEGDLAAYYPRLSGLLQGSNYGLEILISQLETILEWHAQQTGKNVNN